jgi:hypothetical protein
MGRQLPKKQCHKVATASKLHLQQAAGLLLAATVAAAAKLHFTPSMWPGAAPCVPLAALSSCAKCKLNRQTGAFMCSKSTRRPKQATAPYFTAAF